MSQLYGSLPMSLRIEPLPPFDIHDLQRFWCLFLRKGPDECWMWIGALRKDLEWDGMGYGSFSLKGRCYLAHRIAYYFHHRIDPGPLYVLHSCDFKRCVNPAHLSLGDNSRNQREAHARGLKSHEGYLNPSAVLCERVIPEIRRRREDGETLKSIAKSFGVSLQTINSIVTRQTWDHVP